MLEKWSKNLKLSLEDLEFALIDYGLEELEEVGDKIIIRGDYNSFKLLNEGFESLKLPILKASLQRIATTPIELNDEQMELTEKLLDRIEDDDDVVALYTNIEWNVKRLKVFFNNETNKKFCCYRPVKSYKKL